mgnify:CR=1 FL=1
MYRRFRAVVRQDIRLGAPCGQDVQDAVDQPAGVTPRSTNVRLRQREVFPDDFPEVVVDLPKDYESYFI